MGRSSGRAVQRLRRCGICCLQLDGQIRWSLVELRVHRFLSGIDLRAGKVAPGRWASGVASGVARVDCYYAMEDFIGWVAEDVLLPPYRSFVVSAP